MADSFGRAPGEGGPDVRRLLTNPWVLGAGAVALVIGVIAWRRATANQNTAVGTQVATTGIGLQPGLTGQAASTDQMGLEVGGLQGQLSNLTTQLSTGIAGLQSQIQPSAYTVRGGAVYYTTPGSQSEQQAASQIASVFGGNTSDVVGRLNFFDPNGPVGGNWYYPTNVPGYQPGDAPRWNALVVR